ncbi:MAG: hypothetical protein ACREBR_03430, partial [bacterium]
STSNSGGDNHEGSPLKKSRKFVDTSRTPERMSNVYAILMKGGFVLLITEVGQTFTAENWSFPGTRLKSWSTAFDKGKVSKIRKANKTCVPSTTI